MKTKQHRRINRAGKKVFYIPIEADEDTHAMYLKFKRSLGENITHRETFRQLTELVDSTTSTTSTSPSPSKPSMFHAKEST